MKDYIMTSMIDCHCHLNDQTFNGELGLTAIITASDSLVSSERAVKLTEEFGNVYACIGLGYSPKKIGKVNARQKMMEMAKNKKVVGFGEIGINRLGNEGEKEWFEWQVGMARDLKLPMVVHNRNADNEILERLKDEDKVMMHCFTGEFNFMKKCVNRGWYISFGGIITFKNSGELRRVVKETPVERILVETDSPYISPEPLRGSVNQPINVKIVAQAVADIKGISLDEIDRLTTGNTQRLFGIKI